MNLIPRNLENGANGVAIKYIEKIGLTVVDTNYRTRLGEIDIIAKRDLVYHLLKSRHVGVCNMVWHVRQSPRKTKAY